MGSYRLTLRRSVSKDLRGLPKKGVYRILYEIRDDECVLVVVKVGHRREVCRSG